MKKDNLLQQTIESQKIASDPQNSAWVFASAGSGKTKILVDRLLRLLLNKVLGNKILCVTFTKVAALEMQERIDDVLKLWMVMDDENLSRIIFDLTNKKPSKSDLEYAKSLFLQLSDSQNAIKIVTIHSLCQDILKIFPFEVAISPNFEVMDESKEKMLLNKSKSAVFELCNKDKNLENIVTKINSEISQEEYLKLIAKYLNNKEKILDLKKRFFNIDNVIDFVYKNLAIERDKKDQDFLVEFKDEIDFNNLEIILSEINELSKKTKSDQDFYDFFKNFNEKSQDQVVQGARSVFFKKDGDKKSKILSKKLEDHHEFAFDLQEKFEYFLDLINSYIVANHNEMVLSFIDKILLKYQELKVQNQLLDYNDLIIKVNELLNDDQYKDWVKYRLDGFYDHILIDESQDTNHFQWNIIKAISEDFFASENEDGKNRTIFVIGDDKQSIFGFQGADANISDEQFNYYKNLGQGTKNEIKRLDLQNSFRSAPQILDFVDAIFSDSPEFAKNNYQKHNSIRKIDGKVEIWPVFNDKNKDEERNIDFTEVFVSDEVQDSQDQDKINLAQKIADEIKGWIESGRKIPKRNQNEQPQGVQYRDIMIVLRNQTNGFSDILKQILMKENIPFKGLRKINFADNLLLMDLLSLAKFALLPVDDLNLASLLKSPFFRISEEDLLKICELKNAKELSIFEILQDFDENIYKKLLKIIELSKNNNVFEFYLQLIDENFKNNAKIEFDNDLENLEDFEAILEEFFLIISNLSDENQLSLQYFVDFVVKTDPQIRLDLSDDDSVLIATIHSSKGLQAPIVMIPDCCFVFNKMPSVRDDLFWLKRVDENYGEFELPIWLARKKYSSKILVKEKEYRKAKLKEEYLRLFYVALTRAENELYISGFGGDNDADSWYNLSNKGKND